MDQEVWPTTTASHQMVHKNETKITLKNDKYPSYNIKFCHSMKNLYFFPPPCSITTYAVYWWNTPVMNKCGYENALILHTWRQCMWLFSWEHFKLDSRGDTWRRRTRGARASVTRTLCDMSYDVTLAAQAPYASNTQSDMRKYVKTFRQ